MLKKILASLVLVLASCTFNLNVMPNNSMVKNKWDPREAFKSVGMMSVKRVGGRPGISCTVFAVSKDFIASAAHCGIGILELQAKGMIEETINLTFLAPDGKTLIERPGMRIFEIDEKNDVMLFRMANHGLVPLYRSEKSLKVGDEVFTVGAGQGLMMSINPGFIINPTVTISENMKDMIITSSAVTGGFSGSPVFDENGNVIGIVSRGSEPYDHTTIVAKIKYLLKLMGEKN